MKTSGRTYSMRSRAEAVEATRARIARCALERFLSESYDDVTIAGVAKAAGVSHQTVINHFESKEGLFLAAVAIFAEEVEAQGGRATPGDTRSIVANVVDRYEETGDANVHLANLEERIAAVGQVVAQARAAYRAWLEEMLTALLPDGAAERRRAVLAVYAATDVFTWKLLRRDHGLSRADTERVMREMVEAIVASWAGPVQP
jgi:AcrR family transcriptional regulator